MSERRYYTDAYTSRFQARVTGVLTVDGRPAAILDESYFYPSSGGQPNDTGALVQGERRVAVMDVIVREEDDQVLHILDGSLQPGPVAGMIDWPRRFDHMQHHTGQHILSQAFIRVAEAETVSFHLSPASVTIDLDRAGLSPEEIEATERLANEVIWQDRPVGVRDVSRDEAATLPLRKLPPGRDGRLRLIDIDGFDLTACGGTHVARTAQVGLLKIVKVEKRGAQSRVEFCCGGRALADYRLKHDVAGQLAATLTTGYADLGPAVVRLQEESKALRNQMKRLQADLMAGEAARLAACAPVFGRGRLVSQVYDESWDVDNVKLLANQLAAQSGVTALLGLAGAKAQLVFARSADAPGHMGEAIKAALSLLGGARGGGGAVFAQGGGVAADEAVVRVALEAAAAQLREALN